MRLQVLAFISACGVLSMPAPAFASCNILSLCSCTTSASGVAFGSYDPFSASPSTSSGSVTVDCTLSVALAGSYDIALSTGASGSYASRQMAKGASRLNYNLYTSPALTQIWGDNTGGTTSVNKGFAALLFFSQSTSIYARIPAGQNVAAGPYSDTIVVTVTY